MGNACHAFEDLLIASTLHDLSPEDQRRLDEHLRGCPDCRQALLALQEDDRRLTAYVKATDEIMSRLEGRVMRDTSTHIPERDRRNWLRGGWLRFAAAAAAGVVMMIAWYLFGGGSGSGVAWAQVIERVVQAHDYICRIEKEASIGQDMEMVQYCSDEYGLRQDLYVEGKNVAVVHFDRDKRKLVTLVHAHQEYVVVELSETDSERMEQATSAREFVEFFRGEEYSDLGRRNIDGVETQGIETTAMEAWGSFFEEVRIRLWVDVSTQWPVRLEFKGKSDGGKTWMSQVMSDFQWNPSLSRDDFAYEIPAHYKNGGTLERSEATEDTAVEGLRTYARILQGEYPHRLIFASAITRLEEEEPRLRREGLLADADIMDFLTIQVSCQFYADLEREEREPAYYGDRVGPMDFDKVLLRWRLEGADEYRVVYGDLRTETVSAARLAILEGR